MGTQLDANQAITGAYDEPSQALKVTPVAGVLVTEQWDAILANYPDAQTEVYYYFSGGTSGTLVATVTIVYTDSSKEELVSIVKV
jgi:hypothetical protein